MNLTAVKRLPILHGGKQDQANYCGFFESAAEVETASEASADELLNAADDLFKLQKVFVNLRRFLIFSSPLYLLSLCFTPCGVSVR
ncbi:hypothetical protein [Candidatus Vondammii sp. HM_W22]|uniref:hypothetical protein n=1 Tax=Candidatus Vondammii sp. HM_W22 TaxID=2687299 RepID=UPI00403E0471